MRSDVAYQMTAAEPPDPPLCFDAPRWPLPFAIRVAERIPWRVGREVCRSFLTPELPYRAALHATNRRRTPR